MAASSMPILSGKQRVDDGSCTPGAVPVYNASGGLPALAPSRPASGLGNVAYALQLTHSRNDDGSGLTATAATGGFAVANTTGTSLSLTGEGAQNTTKTDKVIFEWIVPQFYAAAANLTVTVSALYAANSGTVSTKTILAKAYEISTAGASTADLIGASASTLTTSAADYTFTISGTNLVPGDRLLIQLTGVITETANGGASKITVNSVRIS